MFTSAGGNKVEPHEKCLLDRLNEQANIRNSINLNTYHYDLQQQHLPLPLQQQQQQDVITPETVSTWFSEGNRLVWEVLEDTSLFFFPLHHPIRRLCIQLLLSEHFDTFILLAILGNAAFIAADDPISDKHQLLFSCSEVIFNSIFFIEFIIKIIAVGGTSYPVGYFCDSWNRLDFTVLFLGWVPYFLRLFNVINLRSLSFIRTIRVLKVLKTVSNVPGMKRLVTAVLNAMPRLLSVGYLLGFVFLIFGIMGVQLFEGQMRQYCFSTDANNPYYDDSRVCSLGKTLGRQCPPSLPHCSSRNYYTHKPNPEFNNFAHFDNIGNSFLTVFLTITLEGWTDYLFAIIDANGFPSVIFFIVLVMVGGYFVVNLTVAVIYQAYVDTLDTVIFEIPGKSRRSKKKGVTKPPLVQVLYQWKIIPSFLFDFFVKEESIYVRFRQLCRVIVDSKPFDVIVFFLILYNMMVLGIEANGAEGMVAKFVSISNLVCTMSFVVDILLRIVAVGIIKFYSIGFNFFDTFIVFVSVFEYFLSNGSSSLSAFRTLRVLRTVKLMNSWKSLQQLVRAVLKSGPGLGYFCILLFLYIFVCALAGISLFAGNLGPNNDKLTIGNPRANFDSFFSALIVIFQCVSGENWNDLIFRAMEWNAYIGSIFYIVVYLLGNMVVLNLFLAILLENFSEGKSNRAQVSYYETLDSEGDVQRLIRFLTPYYNYAKERVLESAGMILSTIKQKFLVCCCWCLARGSSSQPSSNEKQANGDSIPQRPDSNPSANGSDDGIEEISSFDILDGNIELNTIAASSPRKPSITRLTELLGLGGRGHIHHQQDNNEYTEAPQTDNVRMDRKPSKAGLSELLGLSITSSAKKILNHQASSWDGWEPEDDKQQQEDPVMKFVEDDDLRRSIFNDIALGQFRRGNQYFTDCFLGAELVDLLLDREVVRNEVDAVKIGQELLHRRKILPVYIHPYNGDDIMMTGSPSSFMHMQGEEDGVGGIGQMSPDDGSTSTRSQATPPQPTIKPDLSNRVFPPRDDPLVTSTTSDSEDTNIKSSAENSRKSTISAPNSAAGPKPAPACRYRAESYDTPPDDYSSSVATPVMKSTHTASRPLNSYHTRKISASVDIVFGDNRNLYRLSDQGEQVTEWLMTSRQAEQKMKKLKDENRVKEREAILGGFSFGYLDKNSLLRKWCADIVVHRYFESVILVMIVLSSIFLALDQPSVKDNSDLGAALNVSDIIFTIFFGIEMIVKVVAQGCFDTPRAYFFNGWNILDFVVVFISILSMCMDGVDLSFLKALRAFRAVRPLRVVSRSPGMRATINAMAMTIQPLFNFILVSSVFLFSFAILGASLFRNKFHYCHAYRAWPIMDEYTDEFKYTLSKDDCVGTRINGEGYEVMLKWESTFQNFDSIGSSLLTLFELCNMENWPNIMYPAMDMSRIDHHPVLNNSKYAALYFIFFIIVGAYFIANLFIGIIVHKFESAKKADRRSVFLTEEQQDWIDDLKIAILAKPNRTSPVPSEQELFGWKRSIYFLVQNESFQIFMDAAILLNILIMTFYHYDQPDAFSRVLYGFNLFFTILFAVEIALRFVAVDPLTFFKDTWNKFDLIIVIGAIIDSAGFNLFFNITILRVLRIGRVLRLIRTSKNLIILLKTLVISVPSLLNIGSLLFLVFFIFAVLGMNFFGNSNVDGTWMTNYTNFNYFGYAMLLLFRCMTGENWNGIMHELSRQNYFMAVPYFMAFVVIVNYMLVNLFVAVILANFEAALASDPDKVQQKHLEDFIEVWGQIHDELEAEDKDRLPCYTLVKLLHALPPPLGIEGLPEVELAKGDAGQRQLHRQFVLAYIRSLHLKEDSKGRVYFIDVLSALVRKIQAKRSGADIISTLSIHQKNELLYRIKKVCSTKAIKKLEAKMAGEVFTEVDLSVEFNCAMTMQALWRGRQARAMLRMLIESFRIPNSSRRSSGGKHKKHKKLTSIIQNATKTFGFSDDKKLQRGVTLGGTPDSTDSRGFFKSKLPKKSNSDVEDDRDVDLNFLSSLQEVEDDNAEERDMEAQDAGAQDLGFPSPLELNNKELSHRTMSNSSAGGSWLPSLLNFAKNIRHAPMEREYSQLSGISAITKSSWESAIDKEMKHDSSGTDDSRDTAGGAGNRVPFDRKDSSCEWPVTEVVSTRSILEQRKSKVSSSSPAPFSRSRTLSALPTDLAQVKMKDLNLAPSIDVEEGPYESSGGGVRRGMYQQAPRRHTSVTLTKQHFMPVSPKEALKKRRRTISKISHQSSMSSIRTDSSRSIGINNQHSMRSILDSPGGTAGRSSFDSSFGGSFDNDSEDSPQLAKGSPLAAPPPRHQQQQQHEESKGDFRSGDHDDESRHKKEGMMLEMHGEEKI